jgi:uncharacterized protein (DUF885 family)
MSPFSRMQALRALPGVALAAILLVSCDSSAPPREAQTQDSRLAADTAAALQRGQQQKPRSARNDVAVKLHDIVEDYFDEYLALNPLRATELGDHRFDDRFGDYTSPSWMADSLGIEQEALEKLASVEPRALRGEELVTYEAFKLQRELNIGGYRYPSELLPIDPFASLPDEFARLGSGRGAHPFRTARDYDNFLARMDGFVAWVDQAINNLRAGVSKELVLPAVLVARVLPQLESIGAVEDPRQTLFWQPLLSFPAGLTVAERRRLLGAYDKKLRAQVLPAYRRLHQYLAKEYLPVARSTVAWSALPSGDFWYAYLVRYYTSSEMTPAQAHERGLEDVARLRAEVERFKGALGLKGSLREAGDTMRADASLRLEHPRQITAAYAGMHGRVARRFPGIFATIVNTGLEIRSVEPYLAAAAPVVSYEAPSADGARAAVLYVDTSEPASHLSLLIAAYYLQEAVPGRHYRASLAAAADTTLPRFRRFGQTPAFEDGWAAYAASLGRELGVYEDDAFSQFGALALELARAAAVVVDTGLHLHGWSREQALGYLRAQTLLNEDEIVDAVDRCIARPGSALAGPIGQHQLEDIRRTAERQLGDRFDIRQFHEQLVAGGTLPWRVLESKLARWIATQQQ